MVVNAKQARLAITIALGEQRVFHAALAGWAATNDEWSDRKVRSV